MPCDKCAHKEETLLELRVTYLLLTSWYEPTSFQHYNCHHLENICVYASMKPHCKELLGVLKQELLQFSLQMKP